MSLGSALGYSITILEIAVIVIAFRKKLPRLLPIFFAYLIWAVISDAAGFAIKGNSALYEQFFPWEKLLDSLMQFGVLVELGWSVLRPMRAVISRRAIFLISLALIAAGAVVWPLTSFTVNHSWPAIWIGPLRIEQSSSILSILFFLGLAAFSQFLAINWRDRELQVATGLGLYSVVSMGAALLHTHPGSIGQFDIIENFVALSYLCSLLYWGVSFIQKEAPRQEFSPRMQSILLTVAGVARANRVALVEDTRKNSVR